jgi:serine protease Do
MNKDNKNQDTVDNKAPESDFDFLQEKIKERPINKKNLIRRTILTATMAVLFGILACLSFLLLEPVINNWLYPEEDPEIVTFPQEQNEMLPEDMLTEGTSVAQSEEDDILSSYQHEEDVEKNPLDTYVTQYDDLYKVYKEVAASMVTVTGVRSDVDWFNNTYESEGTTAGVIIANNNKELLILSRKSPLDNAQTINISFSDGAVAEAEIKQYDTNTDFAVLAVDLKDISAKTLAVLTVATLGSSSSLSITGTPIIALGNIYGYNDSVSYGIVTSTGNAISMPDNDYKLITTDIYSDSNPTGILVNMDKEVIGIIDNRYNKDETKNLLSAIGITELKGMITRLSNAEAIPYLGLYVQDISEQARKELSLPEGVYIYDMAKDSPAIPNGIQKGDIIMRIGSFDIDSATDYMNALRNVSLDKNIKIVIQRASVNDYQEMEFTVMPSQSN